MPTPPDKIMVGAYVDRDLAERFKAWARSTEGGASAALRKFMASAADGRELPGPIGTAGYRVTVRLKDAERFALLQAATARNTSPTNWLRSLAILHLGRRPQWNGAEVQALRDVFTELRRIGSNINQVAKALNVAAMSGEYPAEQGDAVLAAAEIVRRETRRVVAVMTGNFDYWGLPDAERPVAAYGAQVRDLDATEAERRKIRLRPRRRPARFQEP
jgi:hypothetical protein